MKISSKKQKKKLKVKLNCNSLTFKIKIIKKLKIKLRYNSLIFKIIKKNKKAKICRHYLNTIIFNHNLSRKILSCQHDSKIFFFSELPYKI